MKEDYKALIKENESLKDTVFRLGENCSGLRMALNSSHAELIASLNKEQELMERNKQLLQENVELLQQMRKMLKESETNG